MMRNNIDDALKNLLPVEIVGNHWIHRKKGDKDANFYYKDDVDYVIQLLLARIQELGDK